jgi:hypothetical protein
MGMIGFHLLFPGEAANACRTVTPLDGTDLPSRIFVFMEAYCAEPRCDCRRVMLNVIDAETHDHVTTINYAFEAPKPPFGDEGQMFLDPSNPWPEPRANALSSLRESAADGWTASSVTVNSRWPRGVSVSDGMRMGRRSP